MTNWLRELWDWVVVGTDTELPEEQSPVRRDPLAGNKDGLGNLAAPEENAGAD